MIISIAREFSDTPWGRHPEDSDFCGENFREKHLLTALRNADNDKVVVDLDGVEGLGSSFLEEAFGGLVSQGCFSREQLAVKLEITTTKPEFSMYKELIWQYINTSKFASERPLASAV
jgi:hypothetical protein